MSLICKNSGLPVTVVLPVAAAARLIGVTMPPLSANSVPAPKARHLSAPRRDG
ncbi:MAG: hypothetical protein WDM89_11555 [Rhizomicrobium sp.]